MKIAFLVPDNRAELRRYSDPTPYFGPAPTALLQGFARRNDCELQIIGCTQQPLAAPEQIAPNIFYHALLVPKMGWMRTAYQGCVRAIRKKLREIQPDIVHGQGTERYCALAAAYSAFPNVVTIHGNMIQMRKVSRGASKIFYSLAGQLENVALRKTSGVFCNSKYTESLVANRARETWLVPNAVRDEFFTPLQNQRPKIPQLLCVGTIARHKRQIEILQLATALHRQGHKFVVKFVGDKGADGHYFSEFSALIEPAQAAGYASFVGPKSLRELIDLYDHSSALIHCPNEEAFGLVVAEALSRNLKCFALGPGGMADILDGVAGAELFAEGDWNNLTLSVASWLKQDAPMPTDASATIKSRYHPDRVADAHIKVYSEVLKKTSRKRQ